PARPPRLFLPLRPPPSSPLFPYTTLFRSRRAGMTVGTGQILDLTRAIEAIDVGNREDFYNTARVILVGRREDLAVFDTLFNVFRSEEHTSELQSRFDLVCRLLLEKKKRHY